MSAFGGFARGLVGGAMMRSDMSLAKRSRGILPESGADTAALDRSAAATGNAGLAGSATAENGWKTIDPVATDLSGTQRAFLNAIASPESGGDYNVRYGGENGPQQFEGFERHPGIFEKGPEGPSSAAGRYQFTKSTWDDMGGGAFTPEMQDRRAWDLAAKRYKGWSGRDLAGDLEARGLGADIMSALTPTWRGLKNQKAATAAYDSSLARYNAAPAAPAAAAEPAEPRSLVRTMADNFKANVTAARGNLGNLGNIGTPADNWRDLRSILGG